MDAAFSIPERNGHVTTIILWYFMTSPVANVQVSACPMLLPAMVLNMNVILSYSGY